MSNPGRIADPISCGDFIAQGSSNVIVEDMPISLMGHMTTGHSGFPPTVLVGPCSSTVIVNDLPVVLVGMTMIKPHKKPRTPAHSGVVVAGATSVEIE